MDPSEQGDSDRARFATIMQNLKRDRLASFASSVRYSGHPSTAIIDVPTTPRPVNCSLLPYIRCGSFNAVFTVSFADGTRWVFKIPANGHRQCWDAPAREALTSEAFTMRLIKRETTIPVPEVFAFDASFDNELGCPFTLMELIYGKPLSEVWFEQGSQAKREQIRMRSLHGIAEAMAQLNKLSFSQGGSLLFNTKGDVVGIGSTNKVDFETQYANMRSEGFDNTMAFCQTGPFDDPESYLLSSVDAREGNCEPDIVKRGTYKLLRLFFEWSLANVGVQEKPFVLAHPDLDHQNIFVNHDGSLAGIIDWDWIAAVPHCIGPQSLPKFLTQDFDPLNYPYDVETDAPMAGFLVDSPSQLASYRAMYAQSMEAYQSKEDRMILARNPRYTARIRVSRRKAADTTRRSLVTTTLHLAATEPSRMLGLLENLLEKIEELTTPEGEEEPTTSESGREDGNDEGSDKDGDTKATRVENSDVADQQSGIDNAGSNENVANVEQLSVDELVIEIEKLEGVSTVGNSNCDVMQDPADIEEASSTAGEMPEPNNEAQELGTVGHMGMTHRPIAARACGWIQKKLRGGAKHLYKKPKNAIVASAASDPTPMSARASRALCGWTETKLRRVARCLHCDDEDGEDKATVEPEVKAVRNWGLDVLQGLQTKLMSLKDRIHCEECSDSKISEGSEEADSQSNRQVSSVSKQLTRAEKRSVCGKFVDMVQDNKLCLTVDQQITFAHWIVQTLQTPDFSDTSLGLTLDGIARDHRGDAYGGEGNSANDSGYEEGHEEGDGNDTDTGEANKETEDIGRQSDPSLPGERDHPTAATATTFSNEADEAPAEAAQAFLDSLADEPKAVDRGAFAMLDICVALAEDKLDERRMQRLRDGFFGLLNQTL